MSKGECIAIVFLVANFIIYKIRIYIHRKKNNMAQSKNQIIYVVSDSRSESGILAAFEDKQDAEDFTCELTNLDTIEHKYIHYVVAPVELHGISQTQCPHVETMPIGGTGGIEYYACKRCGEKLMD